MIEAGIIGFGPRWDSAWRPALEWFAGRIRIRAVYDPVANLAEQTAARLGATAVPAIVPLLERQDVRVVLIFDWGWQGPVALRRACQRDKPVLMATDILDGDWPQLLALDETCTTRGGMVLPALGLRYTPATCRLRELIVTSLGPPREI
ncbi:MAG: hypothetical protein KY476_22455, partial [Planctomycetes bacterium]|nr:hypothetical protein [Planctomycetota bacterium]